MTERRRAERRRAEIDWKFYKKVFWLALPIALQSLITIGAQEYQLMIIDSIYEEFEQSYHDMCTRLKDACGTNQYGCINSIGNAIYQDIVGSDIF